MTGDTISTIDSAMLVSSVQYQGADGGVRLQRHESVISAEKEPLTESVTDAQAAQRVEHSTKDRLFPRTRADV